MATNRFGDGTARDTWAIVLAGGVGSRLAPLTRTLFGFDLPKQFVSFDGKRTFLQETVRRIAPIVPSHRTLVVVADRHQELAKRQLIGSPGVEIVAQPRAAGTAAGVLLPLARIMARDAQARVAIFPSDHLFERKDRFIDAVTRGLHAGDSARVDAVLVAATANRPATDLGWILPGAARNLGEGISAKHTFAVDGFIEKPPLPVAVELLRERAWWNTLILTARASALWGLLARTLPDAWLRFDRHRRALERHPATDPAPHNVYDGLRACDLSRDVLEKARGLVTLCMPADAGWSDCGTPERLVDTLRRTARLTETQLRCLTSAAALTHPSPGTIPSSA